MRYFLIAVMICFVVFACQKEANWLSVKPDKSLVVPQTLDNFKALMNNEGKMNILDASIGFIAGEPFYLKESTWLTIPSGIQRNTYIWDPYPYNGLQVSDWTNAYSQIYYCNVVLDGMLHLGQPLSSETKAYNEVRGTALFFRSYAYFKLLSLFAAPYDAKTAADNPGIPLLNTSDVNEKKIRFPLADCYAKILADLKLADSLLPATVPVVSQPSKTAAKALLARVYLSMSDYNNAFDYADKVLKISSALIDYNALNATATYPIAKLNVEDIFHCRLNTYAIMLNSNAITDSVLYKSYAANDLRRVLFFNTSSGVPAFKGSYEGSSIYYSGLATDEMYLIRAETNARIGHTTEAMQDLNALLIKRWKTGTFIPFTATNNTQALKTILDERNKELVFRGLRWIDLRRLNMDNATSITLQRNIGGGQYQLPPGDARYTFLIPDPEIQLSGLTQNPR